jgi:hypothetical protein
MNGWSANDYALSTTVSGVQTNAVVSKEFPISAGGALNMAIKLAATATVVGSITAKLQTAIGDDWVDAKTVAISATGNFYLKLNIEVAGDQTYLPLLNKGRLVVSNTNAGDSVSFSSISVLQEL